MTANRIKPKSLTGNQVKPGSLTGSQINESTLTGVTAASLAGVQYVAATVSLGPGPNPGAAGCPAGTYVIGGGATVSSEEAAIVNDSGPTATRTGWMATGYAEGPGYTMTVTAICTSAAAAVG